MPDQRPHLNGAARRRGIGGGADASRRPGPHSPGSPSLCFRELRPPDDALDDTPRAGSSSNASGCGSHASGIEAMLLVFPILALLLIALLAAYVATDDRARKTTIYECLLVVVINVLAFCVAAPIIIWVTHLVMSAK